MNNAVDISIVIPVKNGEKYLDYLLKAVFSQKVSSEFEVIVVDSGSKDRTIDIITQYPVTLYQINDYEFNHGLTRNFGISKAKGKYIVLMTQDAVPYDSHWLIQLIDAINSDENIAGVYSRQIPSQDVDVLMQLITARSFASEKGKRQSKIRNPAEYARLLPREKYRFCNFDNVSSCIRKEVWEKCPFPKTEFGEDIEWAKTVLERGYQINYEPDSIVYHSHNFSIQNWYRRNRLNSNKLAALFGIYTISNIYKLFAFFLIYTTRDFYYISKNKNRIRGTFTKTGLLPLYSFAGVLGQYRGTLDFKYSKRHQNEDTSSSPQPTFS